MALTRVLSLFSGIGGFELGFDLDGFRTVAQVESDPDCRRLLARRFPDVPRFGNVRTFDGVAADVIVGGFPCQDVSVAGARTVGLDGRRSALFFQFVRIAKASGAAYAIVENVPGLFSSHRGRDFWRVLSGLRECWNAVGYRILDSQYFGVPQRRRRVYLVGGPSIARVVEILALAEGGTGNPPTSGSSGSDVAYPITAGTGGAKFGTGRDCQDTWFVEDECGPMTFDARQVTSGENRAAVRPGSAAPTLTGNGPPTLADPVSANEGRTFSHEGKNNFRGGPEVRRLTPVECERLQGFPDGWTCLCAPLEAYARDPDSAALACRCKDFPRYRMLGNAVTVPVVRWLARNLGRVVA
jgi:DNA (cytosine-5)-methyltransferase 1